MFKRIMKINNELGSLSVEASLSMMTFFMAVCVLLMVLKGYGVEDDIEQMLYDQSAQIAVLDLQRTGELAVLTSAMTAVNKQKRQISGALFVTEADLSPDGTFTYTVLWKRQMPIVGTVTKVFKSTNRLLSRGADGKSNHQNETVYVTYTGNKYHAKGCLYLRLSEIAMEKDEALSKGYEPCWHCIGGLKAFEKAPE